MDALYQDILMDHYRHPRNRKAVANAHFKSNELNPSCGDRVAIEGVLVNQSIADVGFSGTGCVVSQATASLLTEYITGKSIDQVLALDKDALLAMIGIPLGPTRLKCALLPLQALHVGLHGYIASQGSSEACLTEPNSCKHSME